MSRPVRRPEVWIGIGVACGVLLAVSLLFFFTRTDRGRGEVLAYTLATLGGRLNGTLTIERLEGNILTGSRLYTLVLTDEHGELLLRADSAFIEYEAPTLIGGDVVINRFVLYDADLFLRRLPGDTLWNYQAIFADTTPTDTPEERAATLVKRLVLIETEVTVLAPWEPDDDLGPEAREREIRAALSDTSRLVVEEVPGGYVRTMYFAVAEATAADVLVAPDERGGSYLRVDTASAVVHLWSDPPMRLRDLRGQLRLAEGVIAYTVDRAVIGNSALESGGRVDLTGEEPRYDVFFSGDPVALSDLRWLYPQLPEDGVLAARVWLETRPEGLYFLARDARLETIDTRIVGEFGMVTGDTLRFTEVDLRASPLRVETVQRLLPGTTPIEGLQIGSVVIESPSS